MLSAKDGSKLVIAIYAAIVVVTFLVFLVFGSQYLEIYTAYTAAAIFCGYLVTRYIVERMRFTYTNRISVSRNICITRGVMMAAVSLWGVWATFRHNEFNGFAVMVALVLGAELGEFRKMQRQERSTRT